MPTANEGNGAENLPVISWQEGASFATTQWSLILAAQADDTKLAATALERLCRSYWPPMYAYIRREGYGVDDAQDLTQEFLARFIQKDWINHLRDRRGKFRSFLLTFLKHFLSDHRDRVHAQKRGGGRTFVSLDAFGAEERARHEPRDALTPEQTYERRWAEAVITQAAERLREAYREEGKGSLFEQLKDLQPGEHGERSYAEIGAALGMTEQAIKSAALRFRRRYAQMLREEIAQTVVDPQEAEEELQHLMKVFAQ